MIEHFFPGISERFWRIAHDLVIINSVYNVLGFGIPLLLMLIFTPVLINRLGSEGYGLWVIATSALGLMGVFEFGLGAALAKYVSEYKATGNIQGISASATGGIAFNLLLGLLFMVPMFVFAPEFASLFPSSQISNSQVEIAIRLASLGFLPMMLKNVSLSIPKGLQNFKIPMQINIAQNSLTILIAFAVVSLGGDVENVILSSVILMWCIGLLCFGIAIGLLNNLGAYFLLSWNYLKKILIFMFYSGMTGVGGRIFTWLDRIVVGSLLGLSAVAYYTIASGIANKFIAFSDALTQALMPAASSWYIGGKRVKLLKYFKRATLTIGLINILIGIGLLLFSELFLRMWMGEEFVEQVLIIFRILIVVYAIYAINAPAFQIANGIGIPWINMIFSLLAGISTILLIILLVPDDGLIGAAYANLASWVTLLSIFLVYLFLRRNN